MNTVFMDVMTVTDDRLKRRTGPGVGRRNNSQTTVVDNTTIDDNFSGYNNNNNNNNNDVINPPLSTAIKPSLLWKKRRKRSNRSSSSFASVIQSDTKVFMRQHFRRLSSIFLLAIIVTTVSFLFIESYNNNSTVISSGPSVAWNSNLRKQQQQQQQQHQATAAAELMTDFHISFQNKRRKLIAVSQPATKLLHSNMNENEMKEYLHHDDILLNLDYRDRNDYDNNGDIVIADESEYYSDERVAKPRQIYQSDYLLQTDYRDPILAPDDDDNDAYYAFDDDFVKGTNGIYVETLHNAIPGQVCRKTRDHQRNYQNCNTMFETSFVDIKNNLQYIK